MKAIEFLKLYNEAMDEMAAKVESVQKLLTELPSEEHDMLRELVGPLPVGCLLLTTSPAGEPVRSKHHTALLYFPQGESHEQPVNADVHFLSPLFAGMKPAEAVAVIETVLISGTWGVKADPVGLGARIAMRVLENAHAAGHVRAKEMGEAIRRHLEKKGEAVKAPEAPKPEETK